MCCGGRVATASRFLCVSTTLARLTVQAALAACEVLLTRLAPVKTKYPTVGGVF
jgi:hypothetical protein